MRRHIRHTAAALALLAMTGCDNSIMDVLPRDQLSDEIVFSDASLTESVLNNIYRGLGHGLNGTTLWSLTDDGHNTRGGGTTRHMQSNISPSDLGAIGGSRYAHYRWGDLYASIREANIFLAEIDEAAFDPALKRRMKGEAFFLRAYFYHNLLRIHGGVPIVTHVFGLNDDFELPRNSFAETVQQIVADADSAAALLPPTQTGANLGRASAGAALALKARVLLYAASDLYHENPSGQAVTGYTGPQDRTALWRAAKDAAQAVMDLGVYGLHRAEPAPGESPADNYADVWLSPLNEEVILARYFLRTRGSTDIPNVGRYDGPNGYHNWGSNTPTQNLVDAYRKIDGSKFDWNDPADASAPYADRDPRMYASIHFDGAAWVPRPEDAARYDPVGIIQTFRQLTLPDGSTVPGLDTRQGPIEEWNGTYSGYYKRKSIDPTVNHQFDSQEVPWIFFRFAEVLFNYAEASIELGEESDARAALNRIRRRAGMPEFDASVSGAALREEYRNERRVEMAFEEQRFFDARRWMIAPRVFGENAKGIAIRAKATDPADRSTYYDYEYTVIDVEPRAWEDRMYFIPIPRDEMNRNTLLVQNPGY